ncbi:MAG: nicotinamide mononucleotide transporter [Phycisphaerae bacterium]|nr:nicotinamide mononucleotide transporter [Phycisphaerae bacterium]
MINGLNVLMAVVALAGVILNARGKWQGFLLWLISNAWWCGYNIWKGEYVQAFLFGVFWGLAFFGIFYWKTLRRVHNEQIEQAIADATKVANKQLSILLEENTKLRGLIAGVQYHKKAKQRLRVDADKKG